MASNADNVSIWWRHHEIYTFRKHRKQTGVTLCNFSNVSFKGILRSVTLVGYNLSLITANTFTQLHVLQSLNISDNQITHIDNASFSGLSQLVMIDLSNNLLTSLPAGVFDDVIQMNSIYMHGNQLIVIPSAAFKNLHALSQVDLSDNYLVTISDYAVSEPYRDYYKFHRIDLSRNYLNTIPAWLFHLDTMTEIDMRGNMISFKGIHRVLQTIVAAKTVSDAHIVNGATKSLNLRNNTFTGFDISTLDNNSYDAFINILSRTRLDFGESVFYCDCRMFSLYQLLISFALRVGNNGTRDNNIRYNINSFNCNYPVEFRGQSLIQVPINAFGCDKQMSTCPKICTCWVRSVDGTVNVDCVNRNLTRLPGSIPEESIELDLSGNQLVALPEVPDYVHLLEVLDLSRNHLRQVNQNIFVKRNNMSVLRLHGNRLTTLPKTVSSIRHISIISYTISPRTST